MILILLASLCCWAQQPAQLEPPLDDVNGNWTIFSKNVKNGAVVKKFVTIRQNGNKLSGHFKGPNQSGGIEGTLSGHHIVFHTETFNVLTFRGRVDGDSMAGMYGIHGEHAEWRAVRAK